MPDMHVSDVGVGGFSQTAVSTFTRPADTTAYTGFSGTTFGDLIANSTTAANVLPLTFDLARGKGRTGLITGARFLTDSVSAIAAVRLHLLNAPPYAAGAYPADNATMTLTAALARLGADGFGAFDYIGYYDFSTFVQQSDFSYAEAIGPTIQNKRFGCRPNVATLTGMLECRTAFTPASGQRFTVALDAQLD